MRVLVTGGSGFIGSHVVDKLRLAGHEPVIYDLRPSPWHEDNPVETVLGSITDREAIERALVGCAAVAHLAAVADVNDVHAEPEEAEQTNARGTVAVLEAARRAECRRIVYASTIWVYSDCADQDVDEDTLLPPPSHLYTSTKLAGELYCKAYQELYGLEYTILRFGIPYGPRAREAAVIPAFVGKAMRGEPLTLAGDGLQSRKFVYVEDLAEGVAAGLADVAANRVYNLASDDEVTIKDIAETVQGLIGNTEIVYTPARPGDFGGKTVSSDRARDELGWRASTPFQEGVRRYVDWRQGHTQSGRQNGGGSGTPAAAASGSRDDGEGEGAHIAPRPRHVLIISADIGEGHDLPARAVAREFAEEDPAASVSVVNGLPAMGPVVTKGLRENSAFMFRWVPWLFDLQYRLFMNVAPVRWFCKRLITALGRRGLMRLIKAHNPDLIVSTYPGVTAVLGELRRRGKLGVPCYSSITDLAGLHFWAHPGIDLHFITHPESAEEVERIAGLGSVRWAKPPTSEAFFQSESREQGRRALGLTTAGKVITVSGGGWGVGNLGGAIEAALTTEPESTVLCLCGHNADLRTRLAERFSNEPRLRLMGFTDQMGDVLAASDLLVHSSAGLTVLEALIRGCPVISFGFGYGHVRASNAALERFGLAQVARHQRDLGPAIVRALAEQPTPDNSFAQRSTTAALILGDERRVTPLSSRRLRTVRALSTAAVAAAVGGWALTTGASYSFVGHFAHIRPTTAVLTSHPEIGVIVNAPGPSIRSVASSLSARGVHATFAVDRVPSRGELSQLQAGRDQAVPRLPTGGLVRWLGTRGQLHRLLHQLGFGRHFLYATRGASLGQWLLAHGAGGRPIAGAVRLDRGDAVGRLHPGEVIELNVGGVSDLAPLIQSLGAQLQARHLSAVPVGTLMRDAVPTA